MDTNKITSIIAELEYGNLAAQIISSSCVDGYCLTDEQYNVLWTNASFDQIFGYSKEEINGGGVSLPLKENPLSKSANRDLVSREKLTDLSCQAIHRSGRKFFASVSITKIEHNDITYYLYGFPRYSSRVKSIIEMMKSSFVYFIKNKKFFLAEIDSNHPYNIKTITRECCELLSKDYSEMQSKSVLLFLVNESRLLLLDILEDLFAGNNDHCIASLDWKKDNSKIVKTRTIVQSNKKEESFLLLVIPIFTERDDSESFDLLQTGNSSISSQPSQPATNIYDKMFDFLDKNIEDVEAELREMQKILVEIQKEMEYTKGSDAERSKSDSSLSFEEKVFSCLNRYRVFLIPGSVLFLVLLLAITSVNYPNSPYVQKMEKILVDILDKNR